RVLQQAAGCVSGLRRQAVTVDPFHELLRDPAELVGSGAGVRLFDQPLAQPLYRLQSFDPFQELVGREEIVLDELAETAGQSRLRARDDRRVGDRYAEGMTEEGSHGEPVRQSPDYRGF